MEKVAENCKSSQKFGVSRQILDKMVVQLWENFYYLKVKNILISFHAFYFMKKYCLVLKLCYSKIYNIWISPKKS